jgi:cytochrome bd-type quinol oxidase subunit 2
MTRFEKRLCVFAIVFVVVYVGAVVITIHSRINEREKITRIESYEPGPGEGQMMLAELLLPMLILLTVTVCFLIVKRKRAKTLLSLEESDEEFHLNGAQTK